MIKHQSFRTIRIQARSIISLLLVLSCVSVPMTGPTRALSLTSNARNGQPIATRRDAGKPPEASGVQFKSLPLRFELNAGQADSQVRFIARSQGGEVFLTAREMVMCVGAISPNQANAASRLPQSTKPAQAEPNRAVIRLQTVDANPAPRITGLDRLPGETNYFIGSDPKKWRTHIPSYAKVKYENIYPGIDLIYYDNEGNIEYDFNVSAGADPSRIALSVEGADGVHIDEAGDLMMHTAAGEVRQHAPHIYQQEGNGRREIAGGYVLRQDGRVAFNLASYDAARPLVIDPEVVFATYFGGSSETDLHAIAVDAAGSVYVAGASFAHDFPTRNPLQSTNGHSQGLSAIITKLSPDGASLVYSTYLGGSSGFSNDVALGLVLDSTGAAYVTGGTNSTNFPTRNPIQGALAGALGGDLFVSKISPDGSSLVYSTYLGGSSTDQPAGIKLDAANNAYVYGVTSSSDFPTRNPYQAAFGGVEDGFMSVIDPDGSQLLFSTFIGGNNRDDANSLIVIPQTGDIYVSGQSQSTNFLENNGSIQTYVMHFKNSQGSLARNIVPLVSFIITYINAQLTGKIYQWAAEDNKVRWIFEQEHPGQTFIPPPLVVGREQISPEDQPGEIEFFGGGSCLYAAPNTSCTGKAVFVTADATTVTIKRFTNIAESIPIPNDVIRDSQGTVYITGDAPTNALFPAVNPIQSGGGRLDAFVTVFAPVTRQIVFSTYIGGSDNDEAKGITLDQQGNIYIAGKTSSPNFPTKNAYQATPPGPGGVMQGQGNSFIVKLSAVAPIQTGPDFSLGFDSPTVTAQAGTKAKITVNINRAGGFTGNVTVAPGRPGQGIKPKPADSISTTDATAIFKYKTGAAPPGQYPITFTGTDDSGRTRTATVTLVIQ